MTHSKFLNRSVYEGSDMIAMRLRAAKKPAVIPFLEIPPEEIDLEPMTIEPVDLTDAEPIAISPLVVPACEIMPFEDDEIDVIDVIDTPIIEPPLADTRADTKTPLSAPTNPPASDGLSLFGVGTILNSTPKDQGGKNRSEKDRSR